MRQKQYCDPEVTPVCQRTLAIGCGFLCCPLSCRWCRIAYRDMTKNRDKTKETDNVNSDACAFGMCPGLKNPLGLMLLDGGGDKILAELAYLHSHAGRLSPYRQRPLRAVDAMDRAAGRPWKRHSRTSTDSAQARSFGLRCSARACFPLPNLLLCERPFSHRPTRAGVVVARGRGGLSFRAPVRPETARRWSGVPTVEWLKTVLGPGTCYVRVEAMARLLAAAV